MSLPVGSSIGILGGGQLGRMLAMAAARLGYRTVVVDPDPGAPAAQVANEHIIAAYDDPAALLDLEQRCDVVTYEFENVPVDALASLANVRPSIRALEVGQDRLVEKDFLTSIGLRTAPYRRVDSSQELEVAVSELGGRAIIKTRRLGYDGKGQIRINEPIDAKRAEDLMAEVAGAPIIVEGFVDFSNEISVIVVRSERGAVACFPPAANEHDSGILARSVVPCGEPDAIIEAATRAATKLVEALDYVGVLGLELFVVDRDRSEASGPQVLVNEFAPRVHNSGHWTELACVVDQFEQHIRAITGLGLGSVEAVDCEMVNLIGDDVDRVPSLLASGDWRVHLYGKSEVRPGRKMGHASRLTS